jgi:hypothetical protein
MLKHTPPRLATWLVDRFGSSSHGESLAGDLIEQYQKEPSRTWYWKQAIAAVLIGRANFLRSLIWMAAGRLFAGLLAEMATVLTVCVFADEMRRGHSLAHTMNHRFLGTLTVLMAAAAAFAFAASRRGSNRIRGRAVVNVLLLAFGVIALGAGTLTWAAALRQDACPSAGCVCPRE